MYTTDYGYSPYGTTSDVGAILGGAIIFTLIIGIIALGLAIVGVIGQWKAFKKARRNGWECLITGHSQFVNCQIAGINPIWVLILMFSAVLNVIPLIGSLLWLVIAGYYLYLVGVSTAKSFGKSTGFGIGLAIPVSAPIFWFLLKDAEYVGPNPVKDIVMGWFKKDANVSAAQPNPNMGHDGFTQTQAVVNPLPPVTPMTSEKFCTSCGYKVTNGESFCPSCGKAIQ